MSNASRVLEDVICARIHEYADDNMVQKDKDEFSAQIKDNGGSALVEKFINYRGKLQTMVSSEHLTVEEKHAFHSYIEDPTARHTQEIAKINQIAKAKTTTKMTRISMLLIGLVLIVGYLLYAMLPTTKSSFKPLQYLSWEAQSMMNNPEDKLIIKTDAKSEIEHLFDLDKSLKFKPMILDKFSSSYVIEGARIVKYEGIADIAAVQYTSQSSKRLVYFQYQGLLSDLPDAEPGNMLGLIYHSYATDDLNMIAWQAQQNVVGLLVGFDGTEELARYANSLK